MECGYACYAVVPVPLEKGGNSMKDMTKGKIAPQIAGFAVPLVLGNLFQLCYNAADSIIVGKFVGTEALAADGGDNPLMTFAILFINGMCMGALHSYGNAVRSKGEWSVCESKSAPL